MRAWNVKPGAIVKGNADSWQVVVEIRDLTDSAGRMLELVYASGRPESMQPGDNVETAGLTIARVAALRAVGAGGVHRQPVPAVAYNFLLGHGLIEVSRRRDVGATGKREDYQLTVSGRALLAILDAHPKKETQ